MPPQRSRDLSNPVEGVASGLVLLSIVLLGTIPSTLLTAWKVHYVSTGGHFYEKLHPATYAIAVALLLLLLRRSDPVGEIDRTFSQAKLLLVYLYSVVVLLIQAITLGRPVTESIDTFLLPVFYCLAVWQLSAGMKRPLIWTVHGVVLVNVLLGYYEYLSGQRIIPIPAGDGVLLNEWRSSALLGYPLSAADFIGAYLLALIARPSICPWPRVRLALLLLCGGSLAVFGGRTALVVVLIVLAGAGIRQGMRLFRGARLTLSLVISTFCVLTLICAGVVILMSLGAADKIIDRFSSDNGSALTRLESLRLLSHFNWQDLIFGPNPSYADSVQLLAGLRYGVENFWIACIVQYGVVCTLVLTLGLGCFLFEVLKRSHPTAYLLVSYVAIIAASSVSFSSKNTSLAQFIVLIVVLLPRERLMSERHRVVSPRDPILPRRLRQEMVAGRG